MARVHLLDGNFNLNRRPDIIETLNQAGISPEQYRKDIQPFFESLSGVYFAEGPQLRTWGTFPKTEFVPTDLSLSKILEYVSKKVESLQVAIQDRYSFDIESAESVDISPEDKYLIDRGAGYTKYNKQLGLINVSRVDGLERRVVSLGEISKSKLFALRDRLSEEAIDNIIG